MGLNFTEEVMLSSTDGYFNRTNSVSADFASLDLSIQGKKSILCIIERILLLISDIHEVYLLLCTSNLHFSRCTSVQPINIGLHVINVDCLLENFRLYLDTFLKPSHYLLKSLSAKLKLGSQLSWDVDWGIEFVFKFQVVTNQEV